MKSFREWLAEEVEDANYMVKEEYGIRWFFCEDSIFDDFVEGTFDADDYEVFESDDWEVLHPMFEEWMERTKFSFYPSRKDIQARIDEDNAEMRTRSYEMGWGGSFVSDDMGRHTYFDPRDEW